MMRADARRLPATYAAIVFRGKDLDPTLVSAILGKEPTLSYRSGEPYSVKDVVQERRFGLWTYSTRNVIDSDSLKVHLDLIEELLIGARSAWPDSRLKKIETLVDSANVQLRVDIFWYGRKDAAFPKISRSFEQVVTMAGGTVETDFHRDGDTIEAA